MKSHFALFITVTVGGGVLFFQNSDTLRYQRNIKIKVNKYFLNLFLPINMMKSRFQTNTFSRKCSKFKNNQIQSFLFNENLK